MVMENREGLCPRLNSTIIFEVQFETAEDGSIIYKDCSCADIICCASHDETECPWIWYNYFCEQFGLTPVSPEEAAAMYAENSEYAAEGGEYPAEGGEYAAEGGEEAPPAEGEVPPEG